MLFGLGRWWHRHHRAYDADPLDDLSSWPLPKDVAELTGAAWVSRASLHDLLNAVIGSPQVLDTDRSAISAQRAAALSIVRIKLCRFAVKAASRALLAQW